MQFITSLFGGSGNTFVTVAFALAVVIVGILLVLWLLKVLFNATGNVARGRNRRLAVIESLALDPKRQLLIVRRDNVEHLILTGGPHDLVVETGIPVVETAAPPTRRPIPMVPARQHAPAPQAKAATAKAPAPVAAEPAEPAPAPTTAIEKLRERGQPTNTKAHLSLRHTGLLRPVGEKEMPVSPENSTPSVSLPTDSAKEESARRDAEGSDLDEDNSANRK